MTATIAAQLINQKWQECLAQNGITIPLESCPSDDELAVIIQNVTQEDSNDQ